jgi:ribonuclease BN (tRNA processing enzyme)
MRLQILGSAGAEFPNFRPPAFLIDGHLLLDAGTIGSVLSEEEQWKIKDIFITHSHLDHIRSIPALADNIIMKNLKHSVTVHSTTDVISALRDHIFNGVIWPDFTKLPSSENPVITYATVEPYKECVVKGYSIQTIPVNHTVPAVGFKVTSGGKTLVYTGDTGPTEDIWKFCSGVDALIVEVSFPNNMESLAQITKHLTSSMLIEELAKIDVLPGHILITHPKPQYYDIIRSEIECLGIQGIELLHDGSLYDI